MKAILFFAMASFCYGQAAESAPSPNRFYKFDFVVREVEGGKVVGSKSYSTIGNISDRNSSAMIRSGDKVPVTNGKGETTFFDIGTNIDCRLVRETATELVLSVSVDISNTSADRPPVISQTKWNSNVVVPLKKPTIVFSSESATKKITTQFEVTATPLQ